MAILPVNVVLTSVVLCFCSRRYASMQSLILFSSNVSLCSSALSPTNSARAFIVGFALVKLKILNRLKLGKMNAGEEKLTTVSRVFSSFIRRWNLASSYSNRFPNSREQMTLDTLILSWQWMLNGFPSYFSNSSIRQSTSSMTWLCRQRFPNPNFLKVVKANVLCSFHQAPDAQAKPVGVRLVVKNSHKTVQQYLVCFALGALLLGFLFLGGGVLNLMFIFVSSLHLAFWLFQIL